MKKLLFFSCTLTMLWGMKSLCMDAQTLKDHVQNKNWQELANEIKKGKLAANQFSTYTKAALDAPNAGGYNFFQVLINTASESMRFTNFTYLNTNESDNVFNTIEGLIFMGKITHSEEEAKNAIPKPWLHDPLFIMRKSCCMAKYEFKVIAIKTHQKEIKARTDASQWDQLISYLYVQKASYLYLMVLTEQQRASLAQQVTTEIAQASCSMRKEFLTTLQNQLQQLPALQAELAKHNPMSFEFVYNKYTMGGVIIVALLALAYKYYHSLTADEQDDTVDPDELPQNDTHAIA